MVNQSPDGKVGAYIDYSPVSGSRLVQIDADDGEQLIVYLNEAIIFFGVIGEPNPISDHADGAYEAAYERAIIERHKNTTHEERHETPE